MGIGAHVVDILRHLHHGSGPLLAFVGTLPALDRHREAGASAAAGPAVKNRHFPIDRPRTKPYRPDKARILSGDPVQTASYLFVSPDKRFSVGLWTCQRGAWRIDFGEHEFIHILEGVVNVTDAGGEVRTYRAGDAFVSPLGFSGIWDVVEPVTKHFVLYAEPPAG